MSDEIELPEPMAYLNTDCIGERYLCFSAPTGGVTENLYTADQLRAAVEPYAKRIAELKAARFAYASEFPPNEDGDPDVGSIHENIRKLKAELEAGRKRRGEPVAWPLASPEDADKGWTLDYRFIEQVERIASQRTNYTTSMEATEEVLIAANEVLRASQPSEQQPVGVEGVEGPPQAGDQK